MRAAFCLIVAALGATIVHAAELPPPGKRAHVIFTPADVRRVSAYTPHIPYPSKRHNIGGSGIFRLYVSVQTGSVKSTQVVQSTGHQILDDTAIDTLKRWRFKPDVLREYFSPHNRSDTVIIRVPVTFRTRSDLTNRSS